MVFETKSDPEFRKSPFQNKTKKPGPQLGKLRPDLGPNGVQGEPKKCPREPKKDPGGASAAPKGA